jgi:hypothetical protein
LKLPIKIIIIISILLLSCNREFYPLSQNNNEIFWSRNYPLTWTYFKGRCSDSSRSAISSLGLKLKYSLSKTNRLKNFDVVSIFSKKRSCVIDTAEYILNHEQGHFDLTEVIARQWRRELDLLKKNKKRAEKKVLELQSSFNSRHLQIQTEYDDETIHGSYLPGQIKWDSIIKSDLAALAQFTRNE